MKQRPAGNAASFCSSDAFGKHRQYAIGDYLPAYSKASPTMLNWEKPIAHAKRGPAYTFIT